MSLRIAALPPASRPREKLLANGAALLSDAELVALLLRTGLPGRGALELAAELLARHDGVGGLLRADAAALRATPGIGPAKYAELAAVLELARRALGERLRRGRALDSPLAVRDYLRLWLGAEPIEVFAALFLDQHHRLLDARQLWRGTLTHTAVYPRELVKLALDLHAAALVVAHNHPSGVAVASIDDRLLTARLKEALATVDVRLIDHFIVTRETLYSFAEDGLL